MQIQEIIREKKGKLTVRLEGGLSFPIYEKEAAKYRMTEGGSLSDQEWNEICTEILEKRAKRRALYILQRMERTEYQLRQKLQENGYPEEIVQCAIDYVKSFHYVDDYRYACTYIRYHQAEKSRLQLKMKLYERGVASDLIEQALEDEYSGEEEQLIKRLLEKKHYDAETMGQKEKQRLYQYLMRRGFRSETIRRQMGI